MPKYTLVKIPTSLAITEEIEANSVEEVRQWAKENIDTKSRWIIKLDGRNIGEAIILDMWLVIDHNGKPCKRTFNSASAASGWFPTKELALKDYNRHKGAAKKRLDEIEVKLQALKKSLGFQIDYQMYGDTHGIYEDYQYISVVEGGYTYYRKI